LSTTISQKTWNLKKIHQQTKTEKKNHLPSVAKRIQIWTAPPHPQKIKGGGGGILI